jgi:hypothetical protein
MKIKEPFKSLDLEGMMKFTKRLVRKYRRAGRIEEVQKICKETLGRIELGNVKEHEAKALFVAYVRLKEQY